MTGTRYYLNKCVLLPEDGFRITPPSEWETVQNSRLEFVLKFIGPYIVI